MLPPSFAQAGESFYCHRLQVDFAREAVPII